MLAGVLMLMAVAVVVTLFSARNVEGGVPGQAPLLGLAVSSGRFFASSETGLYESVDGKTWSKPAMFSGRPALVAGVEPDAAAVLSGGRLYRAGGAGDYTSVSTGRIDGQVLASSGGSLLIAVDQRNVTVLPAECLSSVPPDPRCSGKNPSSSLHLEGGPPEILSLDAVPSTPPVFFAGGLRAGVWRSSTPEKAWLRVLHTAARVIMVDDRDFERVFLGTAGGLLLSSDQGQSWAFTQMREPVEALAQFEGRLFALAGNRLIYESFDGDAWKPLSTASSDGGLKSPSTFNLPRVR